MTFIPEICPDSTPVSGTSWVKAGFLTRREIRRFLMICESSGIRWEEERGPFSSLFIFEGPYSAMINTISGLRQMGVTA